MQIILICPPRLPYPGKLADVELLFEPGEPLSGLRLVGFTIWQRSEKRPSSDDDVPYDDRLSARSYPQWNLTFPSTPSGKRRFALLRSASRPPAGMTAVWALRDRILAEYERLVDTSDPADTEWNP